MHINKKKKTFMICRHIYLRLLHPTPLARLPDPLMPAVHGVGRDGGVLGRRAHGVLGGALRGLVHGLDGLYAAGGGLPRERRALHAGVGVGAVAVAGVDVLVTGAAPFDWGCRQPTFHIG